MAINNRKPTPKPNTIVRRPTKRVNPPSNAPASKPKTVAPSIDTAIPKRVVSPSEASETVRRQAAQILLRDREIKLLKDRIMRQEEKFTQLKGVAVHMASTATKSNSIKPVQLSDWAGKILGIINKRQPTN